MPALLLETWRREIAAVLQRHQPRLPSGLDYLCDALRGVTDSTDSRRALANRAEEARPAYRRWLVAEGDGYSAILIGWSPRYHTPVHDHDGLWGIELVLCGALQVDEFQLGTGEPRKCVRSICKEMARRSSTMRPMHMLAPIRLPTCRPSASTSTVGRCCLTLCIRR
jgi:hypothetical protein